MYYYTSTDTMCKVLSGAKLFATNLGYMNDSHEYIHGLRTVKKVLEDKGIPENENFSFSNINEYVYGEKELTYFSISFCKDGDLLSQWTTYARESGVSIEMSFVEGQELAFEIESYDKDGIKIFAQPKEIVYVEGKWERLESKKESVLKLLDSEGKDTNEGRDYFISAGSKASAYIKQADFVQEREFRIVFDVAVMKNVPKIEYRVDKHVIKPYLSVKCMDGWPVTAITVGPGFNQGIVFQSVKYFLNHAKIEACSLITKKQWKDQIKAYFQEGGEKLQDIWKEMEADKDSDFIAEWNGLEDAPGEKIGEVEKKKWSQSIVRAIKSKIRKQAGSAESIQEKYREYVGEYCFTMSGIILRKSEIPYIY